MASFSSVTDHLKRILGVIGSGEVFTVFSMTKDSFLAGTMMLMNGSGLPRPGGFNQIRRPEHALVIQYFLPL